MVHIAEGRPPILRATEAQLEGIKEIRCPIDVELHNLLGRPVGAGGRNVWLRRDPVRPMPPGTVVASSPQERETCPVLSDRIFVEMKTKQNGPGIRLLWDTGAMATIIRPVDLDRLVGQGAKVTALDASGYSLRAANGSPMKINAILSVPMVTSNNKVLRVAAIVSESADCSILGMNCISFFGLEVCPLTRRVRTARRSPALGPGGPRAASAAGAEVARDQLFCRLAGRERIPARSGRVVRMYLCDGDGRRTVGRREMVMDAGVAAVVVSSAKDGSFMAPYTNHTYLPETVEKGAEVALMQYVEDYAYMNQAVAAQVQCLRERPRGHTEEEREIVRRKLSESVGRMTDEEFREYVYRLLSQYEDCFSVDGEDMGLCDWIEHQIEPLDPDKVTYVKQFRLSQDHMRMLKDQVASWLKAGIVRRSRSPHNNPIFCIPQPGSRDIRIVVDFRAQNRNCRTDLYSVPSVDQILETVGRSNATIFSSFDLSSSFYHIPLREKDQQYSAFTITNMGQFVFCRSVPGMAGAAATAAKAVDLVLGDVESCIAYVDSVLVYSRDLATHLATLRQVLDRLRETGMRANPDRSVFLARQVDYLGATVDADGVKPTLDRVEGLRKASPPQTRKQLRATLNLFNFLSNFVYNFAQKVGPLQRLTRRNSWKEGELPQEAVEAFDQIKRELCCRPTVCWTREGLPLHLYVDFALGDHRGSGSGMGAVLLQERLDGTKQPVAYLSRDLAPAELHLPPQQGEWTAISWAAASLSHLVKYHPKFYVHTDHKAIVSLQEKLGGTYRRTLKAAQMHLEGFTPIYRYVKGASNVVADWLSRYNGMSVKPAELQRRAAALDHHERTALRKREAANVAMVEHRGATDQVADEHNYARLRMLQEIDPKTREILADIREKVRGSTFDDPVWADHAMLRKPIRATVLRGMLMVDVRPRLGDIERGPKFYIPEGMIPEIVNSYHGSHFNGHAGRDKTLARIRRHHFWPGMDNDVLDAVRKCDTCLRASNKGKAADAPIRTIRAPTGINQRVHIDTFGPVSDSHNKNVYVAVIIEALSNHVTLKVMKDKTPESAAAALMDYIYVFGVPHVVVSDNGREYANKLMRLLHRALRIEGKYASPLWPRCNGAAEKFMDTMQTTLRKYLAVAEAEDVDFTSFLQPLALAHNTSTSTGNRLSPFDAMFGHDPRVPLWESYRDAYPEEAASDDRRYADHVADHCRRRLRTRRVLYNHKTHQQQKLKSAYDLSRDIDIPLYQPRQPVYVRNDARQEARRRSAKLAPKYADAFILKRQNLSQFLVWRPDKSYAGGISRVNEAHIKPNPNGKDWLDEARWEAKLKEHEDHAGSRGGRGAAGPSAPGSEHEDTS